MSKTIMITGANAGIGRAAALALAKTGATIIMVCRNETKGKAAQAEIIAQSKNQSVDLVIADLSSQQSIRQLASAVEERYPRLDVLINNAGGFFAGRDLTVDGLEYTFALNHLGYFLLTNLLLDLLKSSAPARIINLSSDAQAGGTINFDDLQGEASYSGFPAYSQSKLANILFTYELARRLGDTAVTVNAVHPGMVRTNFGKSSGNLMFRFFFGLAGPFLRSPAKGADTAVFLATSPDVEGVTGKYFFDRKEKRSNQESYDTAVAERLWHVSEELTGLNG